MTAYGRSYRAAVIGHTGRGGYGHGLDIVFNGLPNVNVVAVADPDEVGRKKAQDRNGAPAAYTDYHEMLEREKPNLVSIGPRVLGERVAMVEAVAAAGAHIYMEKPMAASLAEADAILAACDAAGVKMATAHQGRLHPATLYTHKLLLQGDIGTLRLVRTYGKLDHRGGGEDLTVLGTHMLDLMRLYAGDVQWVSADLVADSHLAGPDDMRRGGDEIAPIMGDGLRATFGLENGAIGLFESFVNLATVNTDLEGIDLKGGEDLLGIDLIGEKGQLSLRGVFRKRLYRYPHSYVVPGAPYDRWDLVPVPDAAPGEVAGTEPDPSVDRVQVANQRIVIDLLAAVEEGREPLGSGQRARAVLELTQAAIAAHLAGGRITLPLQQREHPLVQTYSGLRTE